MIEFLLYQSFHPNNPEGMLILADHLEEQGDNSGANAFRNLESAGITSLAMLSASISSFAEVATREFPEKRTYWSFDITYLGTGSVDQFNRSEENRDESFGIGLSDDYSWTPRINSPRGSGMTDVFGGNDGRGEGMRENWTGDFRQRLPNARTETFGIECEFSDQP